MYPLLISIITSQELRVNRCFVLLSKIGEPQVASFLVIVLTGVQFVGQSNSSSSWYLCRYTGLGTPFVSIKQGVFQRAGKAPEDLHNLNTIWQTTQRNTVSCNLLFEGRPCSANVTLRFDLLSRLAHVQGGTLLVHYPQCEPEWGSRVTIVLVW